MSKRSSVSSLRPAGQAGVWGERWGEVGSRPGRARSAAWEVVPSTDLHTHPASSFLAQGGCHVSLGTAQMRGQMPAAQAAPSTVLATSPTWHILLSSAAAFTKEILWARLLPDLRTSQPNPLYFICLISLVDYTKQEFHM